MAMIMCPDCGTSISDKALTCPYCGYAGNDPATPIADQSIGYEVVPRIKMSIERWDPKSRSLTEETSEMPIQARRAVARWLGSLKDWESLQVVAPALVGFVKEFLGDDKVRMVADLPAEIMKMVKEGRLRFRPLCDEQVWRRAVTNGIFVRFDNVELSHDEILSMAERAH